MILKQILSYQLLIYSITVLWFLTKKLLKFLLKIFTNIYFLWNQEKDYFLKLND